jgi:hypothetical protein
MLLLKTLGMDLGAPNSIKIPSGCFPFHPKGNKLELLGCMLPHLIDWEIRIELFLIMSDTIFHLSYWPGHEW